MNKKIEIDLPNGKLIVETKGSVNEYPGVLISLKQNNEPEILVATVEYENIKNIIQTVCYEKNADEPISVIEFL